MFGEVRSESILKIAVGVLILIVLVLLFLPINNNNNNNQETTVEVQNIVLSKNSLTLTVGNTHTLASFVSPSNAANKKVTYMSSNGSIATIDQNGNIRALKIGETKIIAMTSNGKQAECKVKVVANTIPVTSISIERDDIILTEGESTVLKTIVTPSNTTEHSYKWTSSDTSVATVDSSGKVTAKKKGSTLITVTTKNKKIAICDIEVKAKTIVATGISLNAIKKTIKKGESFTLQATITPSNVDNKTITWTSSNSNVASVSNGKVTGKSAGSAVITAKTSNGKTATCTITVKNAESSYVITEDSKYNSYKQIASYNSSTLKYKIINANSQDFVLIWVSDPINQLNGALADSKAQGVASAETMLNNSIPSNKGMVAVNASFFSSGTPLGGVVINKGKIVKNTGLSGGIIGINSSGNLVHHNKSSAADLQSKGIRNTFVISSPTHIDNSTVNANRTQICQIDYNNFAILSGSGTVMACGNQLMNLTGCKVAYNLDGGGSRKLYYKTNSKSLIRRFGGDRKLPDMLYFVEK